MVLWMWVENVRMVDILGRVMVIIFIIYGIVIFHFHSLRFCCLGI